MCTCTQTERSVQITAAISFSLTTSRAVKWNPPTPGLHICLICVTSFLINRHTFWRMLQPPFVMYFKKVKRLQIQAGSLDFGPSCIDTQSCTFPGCSSMPCGSIFHSTPTLPGKYIFQTPSCLFVINFKTLRGIMWLKVPSGATGRAVPDMYSQDVAVKRSLMSGALVNR